MVDLDGTIRRSRSGNKFINCPEDQEIIPNADKALDLYKLSGLSIVGISNQAGVHFGHKDLNSCIQEQQVTLALFPQLDCIYFCPDLGNSCYKVYRLNDDGNDTSNQRHVTYVYQRYILQELIDQGKIDPRFNFRKPSPGMLHYARLEQGNYPINRCLYTGDRPEDKEAASLLSMNFVEASVFLDVLSIY